MNKNLMIGLGVLAVAGIGLYMWNKKKSETKSKVSGSDDYSEEEEEEFDENEEMDDSDSMDYSDEGYSNFRLPKWLGGSTDESGFKKCSCSAKKPDGTFDVWQKTCSKSVACVDCCESSGNASRVMVKRPRRFM